MWTKKKCYQQNEPDITAFRTAHWSKRVPFMQNLEHDVTVSNMMSQLASNEKPLSVGMLFSVYCFQ